MKSSNQNDIKYELSKIRNLLQEQNNQINWGPIVALMSVFFSAIVYVPNLEVLVSVIFFVIGFTIFLCRKNIKRYRRLMTIFAHLFVIAGIMLLILSFYSDFYDLLRQPLSIKKSK